VIVEVCIYKFKEKKSLCGEIHIKNQSVINDLDLHESE